MKRSWRWWLGGTCVVVGLGAWELAAQPPEPVPQGPQAFRHRMAPDFTLCHALGGSPIELAKYRGQVVLVNFFETGCPHCQHEARELAAVYRTRHARGFEVIGIVLDENDPIRLGEFARTYGIRYPLAVGTETAAARYGGVNGVPLSFLIDRKGRIAEVFVGAADRQTLDKAIQQLL